MKTYEERVVESSQNPAFLQVMLGGVKLAFRLFSLPGIRRVSSWVDPKKNFSGNVPINVDLTYDNIPLPAEIVHEFIDKSSHRMIMNVCGCRQAYSCENHPRDLGCLFMGESVLDILPALGRLVSREEAHEHVDKGIAQNLTVHIGKAKVDNFLFGVKDSGKLVGMCFCCHCCCIAGFFKKLPIDHLNRIVPPIEGLTIEVTDACTGCGKCIEYCLYDAISIEDGTAVHNEFCRQCGRCSINCPTEAIKFKLDNPNFKDEIVSRIESYADVT
jgi:UDP-glucose 4-epimerase